MNRTLFFLESTCHRNLRVRMEQSLSRANVLRWLRHGFDGVIILWAFDLMIRVEGRFFLQTDTWNRLLQTTIYVHKIPLHPTISLRQLLSVPLFVVPRVYILAVYRTCRCRQFSRPKWDKSKEKSVIYFTSGRCGGKFSEIGHFVWEPSMYERMWIESVQSCHVCILCTAMDMHPVVIDTL